MSFGVCRDDLDAGGRTDTFLDDAEEPVPGAAFLNLITAEDVLGVEGSMGLGTQADRSNFGSCP